MLQENWTTIKEFILVGFPELPPEYYGLVSCAFFFIYVITMAGNSLLVILFAHERSLQKPMYGIMVSLALSDMGFSTTALPKIIARYWFNDEVVPFDVCLIQMLLIHYFGSLNSFIMMIMALDRYIAICNPLRYPVLMTSRNVIIINVTCWITSFITPTISIVHAYEFPYCGPNRIIQCYCDHNSISKLACANIKYQYLVAFVNAMIVLLVPLAFIIFSYGSIIFSVMRIVTSQGRWKAFTTCSTQLCIIALYYFPRCSVYITNVVGVVITPDLRIALILLYSVFPPFINPFIYCFRAKEIKEALARWVRIVKFGPKVSLVTTVR
ncbi:olfactory receptor 10A5-like [Denticeps clupeoides]|uniref:olfactory receptor 10A5-like n=1 Tax=Denticeps clupeoides TaxID=299321 RepID=UPI0010A56F86|nr:olfactory receptor 10A5-like [Denticeps clupeoides]